MSRHLDAQLLESTAVRGGGLRETSPHGYEGRIPASRRFVATAVAVAAVAVAASCAAARVGPFAVLGTGAVVLLTGAATAAAGRRAVGVAIALSGSGAALVGCYLAALPGPGALVAAMTVALVGMATGHRSAGLVGAAVLVVQVLLWWGAPVAGLSPMRTSAVVAVVGAGLLGLLPRLAVTASGLAALDDRRGPGPRLEAEAAVSAAHRGLIVAVAATAASTGLAGWILAGGTTWGGALAGVTAVVLLLRLRAYPLTVEAVAVLSAALAVMLGLVGALTRLDPGFWWVAVAAPLGVAALAFVPIAHRPRPRVRARARQLADHVETVAVVATVPLAAGVFGAYERLLATW